MRRASRVFALMLVAAVMRADDELAFLPLLSVDQLSQWSGDREFWTVDVEEIRGHSTRESKPLVYEGRAFRDYVLRFSAQVSAGTQRLLRGYAAQRPVRLVSQD